MKVYLNALFNFNKLGQKEGEKVAELITEACEAESAIVLDFDGIKVITPPFIVSAFFPIMSQRSIEYLKKVVGMTNINDSMKHLIFNVLLLAHEYTEDDDFRQHIDNVVAR